MASMPAVELLRHSWSLHSFRNLLRTASHRHDISEQRRKARTALLKHARKKHGHVLSAWEAHRELVEHRRTERRTKQNRKRRKTNSNHYSKHVTHSLPGHNGPAPTNIRRLPYGEKLQIATLNCSLTGKRELIRMQDYNARHESEQLRRSENATRW